MSSGPENFAALRRLLAFKRHEQPPPGYFHTFSKQVIDRIVAERQLAEAGLGERMRWEAPWLQRLLAAFQTKPALGGAFGLAVCALLVAGVVYSEKPDSTAVASAPPLDMTVAKASLGEHESIFTGASTADLSTRGWVPAVQPGDSLFSEIQRRQSRPFQAIEVDLVNFRQ